MWCWIWHGSPASIACMVLEPMWSRVQKIISHNVLHDYTRDYIVTLEIGPLSGFHCLYSLSSIYCWGTISAIADSVRAWGTESTSRYCPGGQNLLRHRLAETLMGLLLYGTEHLLHIARSFSVLKRIITFD